MGVRCVGEGGGGVMGCESHAWEGRKRNRQEVSMLGDVWGRGGGERQIEQVYRYNMAGRR